MKNKVYIVLVNYNGWHDTVECLESISSNDYKNYQVIVVDNCSEDDSFQSIYRWGKDNQPSLKIYKKQNADIQSDDILIELGENAAVGSNNEQSFDDSLVLIRSDKNGGFAYGNNIAIKFALGFDDFSYIWLLNNDVVIKADSLSRLVSGIERYPYVGAVGSKILYYDKRNLLQNVGSNIDTNSFFKLSKPIVDLKIKNYDDGKFDFDFEVNDIMGASLLVRREVIDKVGLMPEEYFLYGEETDWNYSIQKANFKLMTIGTSVVYHKKGASTGGDGKPISIFYRIRNQFILNKKHLPILKYYLFINAYVIKKIFISYKKSVIQGDAIRKGLLHGILGKKGECKIS